MNYDTTSNKQVVTPYNINTATFRVYKKYLNVLVVHNILHTTFIPITVLLLCILTPQIKMCLDLYVTHTNPLIITHITNCEHLKKKFKKLKIPILVPD